MKIINQRIGETGLHKFQITGLVTLEFIHSKPHFTGDFTLGVETGVYPLTECFRVASLNFSNGSYFYLRAFWTQVGIHVTW